jgi:hypothetical protein
MMWLTWRQFRAQAWVTSAALALVAVGLLITGLHVAHLYTTTGLPACQAHGDCQLLGNEYINELKGTTYELVYYAGIAVLYAVPALIGVFWGAPLVTRELETGTFRLAWNQSVTRTRWLTVKLGLLGLAAMATAGLLTLMVTWWASPVYRAAQQAGSNSLSINRFEPTFFGSHGIVPIGYAAFAFALGVTAGVLIRRTVPAMAATLAVFLGVQILWPILVRPHLMTPLHATAPVTVTNMDGLQLSNTGHITVTAAENLPGAWVLSSHVVNSAGHVFAGPAPQACVAAGPQACTSAIAGLHLRVVDAYQPASRFWAFQWYEMVIFLAIAAALAGFCMWRVRRRRLA